MDLAAAFPILLATHIVLAVSLLVPAFLLPFTLRTLGREGAPLAVEPGRAVRALRWVETHGTLAIGVGVAVTGAGLLLTLGASVADRPWLLLALASYAGVLASAFFIQRPGVRALLGRPVASTPADHERWRTRARRQRYLSYLMAAAVGLIAWLMTAKPGA